MVLKVLIIALIVIVISLLLYFLMEIFIPVVSKQIGSYDNYFLSKFEHKFEKLQNRSSFVPYDFLAFVDSVKPIDLTYLNLPSFKNQSCKTINKILKSVDSYKFVCFGVGDCLKSCPQKAIFLQNSEAVVSSLCMGCGKCLQSCPKKLITMVPKSESKFKSENTEKKFNWPAKKGFKLWESCYRIVSHK